MDRRIDGAARPRTGRATVKCLGFIGGKAQVPEGLGIGLL